MHMLIFLKSTIVKDDFIALILCSYMDILSVLMKVIKINCEYLVTGLETNISKTPLIILHLSSFPLFSLFQSDHLELEPN